MYKNLQAELARNDLAQIDLAKHLGLSAKTVSNKMNGITDFTLKEVNKIMSIVDNYDLIYLFKEEVAN